MTAQRLRKLDTVGGVSAPPTQVVATAGDPFGAPTSLAASQGGFSGNASGSVNTHAPRYENLKHSLAPKKISAGGLFGTGILAGIVGPKVMRRRVSNRIAVPNYSKPIGGIGGTGHLAVPRNPYGSAGMSKSEQNGGVLETAFRVGVPDLVEGLARNQLRSANNKGRPRKRRLIGAPPTTAPGVARMMKSDAPNTGLPGALAAQDTSVMGKSARSQENDMPASPAADTAVSPLNHLEAMVKRAPVAQQPGLLMRIGVYTDTLAKNAEAYSRLDEEDIATVVTAWLDEGDALTKSAVWNMMAEDHLQLDLPAAEPDLDGGLEKVLAALPDDDARSKMLMKAGSYTHELEPHVGDLSALPDAELGSVLQKWFESGDADLKKAVASQVLHSAGRAMNDAILGGAAQAGKIGAVVRDAFGNSSSHVSRKIGSKVGHNADAHGAMGGIPNHGGGEGGGKRPGGDYMPRENESAAHGSPDHDDSVARGAGGKSLAMRPTMISRKGTSGGMGTHAGPQPGKGAKFKAKMKGQQDRKPRVTTMVSTGHAAKFGAAAATLGAASGATATYGAMDHARSSKAKRAAAKGAATRRANMGKVEDTDTLGEALVKIAPNAMIAHLMPLPAEARVAVMGDAETHASDLLAFAADPAMQKRDDLAEAVDEWMNGEGDPALKKWIAEGLAGAEQIPTALAEKIMAWQPARQAA